jgi:hypothetical protein
MACFLVPAAEAVIATVVRRTAATRATAIDASAPSGPEGAARGGSGAGFAARLLRRVNWLTTMLWGGTALLALEHLWHGEVTPWFPFLTAAAHPADRQAMFHEMATVGVGMAVAVTLAWAGLVAVADALERRGPRIAADAPRVNA